MIRIMILGGTRYLGKTVADRINKEKFEVATLSRSEHVSDGRHFVCDRKNTSELKKCISKFQPNVILDMTNFDAEDSESISKLYQMRSISDLNHYIMVSSFYVYNYFEYNLFAEKQITDYLRGQKIDGYTERKIKSELNLYPSKLMEITTILRLPFVFSSDDYLNRFQRACDISLCEIGCVTYPSQKYSLIRKYDAAEAIIKLIKSDPMGIVDLSNSGCVTSEELFNILHNLAPIGNIDKKTENINFPYYVEKDICLNSGKFTINSTIFEALNIEAKYYWENK